LHFRNAPKEEHEKKRKKKHLTVWLFGIHCEFKGRLSDRNNKEARDGSVDDNVRPRGVGGGKGQSNCVPNKPQGTLDF